MSVTGSWDATMKTPIGSLKAVFTFDEESGVLVGRAEANGDRVEMHEVVLDGNRLTWKQSVRKPMRLNLNFDLTVDGDTLHGISRAGTLPTTEVSAIRIPG